MKRVITSWIVALAVSLACAACKDTTPPSTPTASTSKTEGGKTVPNLSVPVQAGAAGDTLESLGVTLPSFDELRAKATQSINTNNADAEFEQLQLEAEAEGG